MLAGTQEAAGVLGKQGCRWELADLTILERSTDEAVASYRIIRHLGRRRPPAGTGDVLSIGIAQRTAAGCWCGTTRRRSDQRSWGSGDGRVSPSLKGVPPPSELLTWQRRAPGRRRRGRGSLPERADGYRRAEATHQQVAEPATTKCGRLRAHHEFGEARAQRGDDPPGPREGRAVGEVEQEPAVVGQHPAARRRTPS